MIRPHALSGRLARTRLCPVDPHLPFGAGPVIAAPLAARTGPGTPHCRSALSGPLRLRAERLSVLKDLS